MRIFKNFEMTIGSKMGWKSILFLVARCLTCGKLFGETEDFVKILIIEMILIRIF